MHLTKSLFFTTSIALALLTTVHAADMTAKEVADARAKVQTAVALAELAKQTKDGDALLVAARLIASSGNVAVAGETGDSPKLYDARQMAADAKALGADAAKADLVGTEATAMGTAADKPSYWINTCDYSGYCAWAWID